MAAKTKRPAPSGKSATGGTTMIERHQQEQSLAIDPAIVAAEDRPHRANQPYQGQQQYGHFQPTRSISTSEYPSYSTAHAVPSQNVLSSPYLGSGGPVQHQSHAVSSAEASYYNPHPSPRSTQSATGPYYSSDKPEPMAVATAHMQRPYPPIYHTPQSNSPVSVSSPQTHDGRPMYAQPPQQMPPSMYGYSQYPTMNQVPQSTYGQHPTHPQHQQHQIPSQSMLPYQQTGTPQMAHPQPPVHSSTVQSSPRPKQEPQQPQQQQPVLQGYQQQLQQQQQQQQQRTPLMPQQHIPSAAPQSAGNLSAAQSGSATQNSNAAPGPIPATTPLVVRQDGNGVQWISFEYSRDRVKMEYTIRCDVESVNVDNLSQEFKSDNCVYPRACVPKEQYKGNRLQYETDCNAVGWSLAELNPCLRSKRGLIQRAVDSWRNSNQDQRLRSRRVRRQAKLNTRTKMAASTQVSQPSGPPGPISTGLPSQSGSAYSTVPQQHQQVPSSQLSSPNDLRQAHVFQGYQAYPQAPSTMGPSMPPSMAGQMHHQMGRQGGSSMSIDRDEKDEYDSALFGDVPEGKRRKFVLVDDTQDNKRVRVKVMLDQVQMSEIPDSFRKQNAVHPRSYFPVQMPDSEAKSRDDRFASEDIDEDDGLPTVGRTMVPVRLAEGDGEMEVPMISRFKRGKEDKLNELGHRMAWAQSRAFAGRPIFLQKSLDAYRDKQREKLISSGQDPSEIPTHLETRPGKRRWVERTRGIAHTATPPAAINE